MVKSITVLCACCFGVAQILPCQKMHDHICYICKETLPLLARQTFPSVSLRLSYMNRHIIRYKQRQYYPHASLYQNI
jgi:hypothetical protein